MSIAVYPGSFDPFTMGHLDVLKRACHLFDTVYVGVLHNTSKQPAFTLEERESMVEQVIAAEGLQNAKTACFDGLLVEFAAGIGADVIIRGLRSSADFEYEAQIGTANKYLAPSIETVYLVADGKYSFISSGIVREVGTFKGALDGLVPDSIKNIIAERLIKR